MSDQFRTPLVSVVMNAHNSETYLPEAIQSVVGQSYENWEIVLWDNASSDATSEIVENLRQERIRYFFFQEKISLYESRVKAIQACTGDLIAFLDCDDLWHSDKLQQQVPVFQDNRVVGTCSDYWLQYETQVTGRKKPLRRLYQTYEGDVSSPIQLARDNRIGLSSLVIRASAARQVIPSQPSAYSYLEDLDLAVRLIEVGVIRPLATPLMVYRIHGTNHSNQQDLASLEIEHWIANLDELGLANSDVEGLKSAMVERGKMLRARAHMLKGERVAALGECRKMRDWRPMVKIAVASILPLWLLRRLAR